MRREEKNIISEIGKPFVNQHSWFNFLRVYVLQSKSFSEILFNKM